MTAVALVAATLLEARAARAAAGPGVAVHRVGVGARREPPATGALLLSVGLCGALVPELEHGTLVIPDAAATEDGRLLACDPAATATLREAATARGVRWVGGSLLTAAAPVVGARRAAAAATGAVAADMETAHLLLAGRRVAAVRAVLDGPGRELPASMSGTWATLRHPRTWAAAARLARPSARGAASAAAVAAAALPHLRGLGAGVRR